MQEYYVDLHVHIGLANNGDIIKRATSHNLTFENIAHEAYSRKGIDIIGVVDAISPSIIEDIQSMLENGLIEEHPGGGMFYKKKLGILLGAEIETREPNGGHAHSIIFFPSLKNIVSFFNAMKSHIQNSKFIYNYTRLSVQELFNIAEDFDGLYMPAHIFSPHKSLYGNCCSSLAEVFNAETIRKISAIELGLSADAMMASQKSELDNKTFTSNSDTHSLSKMGREYNIFQLENVSFDEVKKGLQSIGNRKLVANYGLNPKLGKYHRSFCINCNTFISGTPPQLKCPVSPKHKIVRGVLDRLEQIKDRPAPAMINRAPYHYQVPLEFLPGVGPKTIDKLLYNFGTEMNILHKVSFEELAELVKESTAKMIIQARKGTLAFQEGGGGIYGKVMEE